MDNEASMITVLLYILLALFGLKILWNLFLPYSMAVALLKCKNERTSGVTLMTFVEIGLLLAATGVAALSDCKNWFHNSKNIACWGGLAIVFSYVHLVVVGFVAGWVVSLLKKNKK